MRVTSRGVGLLLAGGALLSAGLVFGYPELTVLGCAAVVCVVVAFGWVWRRWALHVTRVVTPDRVVRGGECRGIVTVHNRARWRGMDVIAFDHAGGVEVPIPALRLSAGKDVAVAYMLPTERRGVIDVGPVRIERRDPLDLVRTRRDFGETRRIWVHPKARTLRSVPAGAARSLDGLVDKIEHGSITFHALREYVAGDDLRHVHWRTSARVGELMVREHVDTSQPRVLVLLDDRIDPLDEGGRVFEDVVEVAASVLLAALRDGLSVTLHLVSGGVAVSSQAGRSPQPFLDALAEVSPKNGSFEEAVDRLHHRRIGDTLVVLTGAAGEADTKSVARLRSMYPSIVVAIMGQRDVGMSSDSGMLIIGSATSAELATAWDGVAGW